MAEGPCNEASRWRRDSTKLVDRLLIQVNVVRDMIGDVHATDALCFIEADSPLFGGAFTTREVKVLLA